MGDFFGQVPCWPGPSKYQEVTQNLGDFLSTQAGLTMGIHDMQTDLTMSAVWGTRGNALFPREKPIASARRVHEAACVSLSALGVGVFDVRDFFMDIRVAHQVHERAFSSTGREKRLREFVTQVTLVIVPSVLRREKCSLGILARCEQL